MHNTYLAIVKAPEECLVICQKINISKGFKNDESTKKNMWRK